MRLARIVLVLTFVMLIVSPLWAADKKDKKAEKKAPPCPAAQKIAAITKGLTLTAEQKTKLDAVAKEFGPKLVEANKKLDVLTPEQKKARDEAIKEAKTAGKKGKELHQAVEAAVKLTDAQKAEQTDARKERSSLEKQLFDEVMGVLTPEQQKQVKAAQSSKKKKESKAEKPAAK